MAKFYKSFYGDTASIKHTKAGWSLKVFTPHGFMFKKSYPTERGARNVMGRFSDSWSEVI